jgi:hypothetical protein
LLPRALLLWITSTRGDSLRCAIKATGPAPCVR